jgi:type IV pilus assembly protein PilB
MDLKTSEKLAKYLTDGQFITPEQLTAAQEHAEIKKISLEKALLAKEYIKDEELGQLVAQVKGWLFVNLAQVGVNEKVARLIPERVAKKQQVIAFDKTEEGIKVAMSNPDDTSLIHLLEKSLNTKVIAYYCTTQDIISHFDIYKRDISEEFDKIVKAEAAQASIGEAKESSTIQIVDLLIQRGYENQASDIHIEPMEDHTQIRFRIDGVMHDTIQTPRKIHDLLVSRIKVMSKLRTDEHQMPQDGKLEFVLNEEKADVRVSVVPTTKGENVVMRLLTEKSRQFTMSDIGLTDKDFKKLKETIKKPWGMILVTGPTGSGKTTSLYSILKILNKREVNIATIEDPVEYTIDGVTQIQVNNKTKLTFASGLRSIVRQDPDIIMVGEIRDKETAQIAIDSAMTGHLVLSTLHTNDAATTLTRIIDMDIAAFLASSTINVIVAQRLVRRICPKCIQSYETDLEELSTKIPIAILEKLARGKETITLYKGGGCTLCSDTGYSGRVGVFEILEIDDEIRSLIMDNANSDQIKSKAVSKGMTTMFEDAREKVLNGITTIDEMLRVVKDK